MIEDFNAYQLQGIELSDADFDGDGDTDLLIATGLGLAGWYPNMGNGTIGERNTIGKVMAQGQSADMADIDLDGDLDIVVPNKHSDMVTLYRSNNDGTFSDQEIIAEHCDGISSIKFADLNGDGKPDLITNVKSPGVIWNTGTGWTPGILPDSVIAKQPMYINADVYIDLLCDSLWLQNDGSGNFTKVPDPDIPQITAIDTADLNGNGFTDAVVLASFNTDSYILFKDGSGDFMSLPINNTGSFFCLDDMDGDGDIDLAGASVRLNDGSGNFGAEIQYPNGNGSMRAIETYDVDGDGNKDLINSRSGTYDHYVYVNRGIGGGLLSAAELLDNNAGYVTKIFMTDVNNDSVNDMINICWMSINWRENIFTNAYRFRGAVFQDFNMDAVLDPTEPKIPFQLVRSNANNYLVWTNSNGDYDLGADTGSYKVWVTPPAIYDITNNPDTLFATLSNVNPIQSGLDFGLTPVGFDSSALLTLTSSTMLTRCNTNLDLFVDVKNTGVYIPTGTLLKIVIHTDITVNSFLTAPDSISGNEYYWILDSLGLFQLWSNRIAITTGPFGSFSTIAASLNWNGSSNPLTDSLGGLVNCAWDPNDKSVTPVGYGVYGAVSVNTDEFIYTIRFQNTGTDTAFTVNIKDVLDPDLDWTTLDILATSHPLTGIQVDNGGQATFRFDQILLPDSNVNEPGSHGFIKYKIRTKNQLDGTEIRNTALIYFDLNSPVITNTVINTLKDCQNYNVNITQRSDTLYATAGENYQWYLNGNLLAGSTGQWLVPIATGDYTVVVNDVYGCTDTSNIFNVICTFQATVIATGTGLCPNSSITLSTQSYDTYQWYRNGVALTGETAPTLQVTSIPGSYATYRVMATLNGCSELSVPIVLYNVTFPVLTISSQGSFYPDPTMQYFMLCDSNSTDSVVFSINSFANTTITWFKNGTVINGASGNTLIVKTPGAYTASITSPCPGHIINSPDTFLVAINANHPVISWNGTQLQASPSTLNNWQWYLNNVAIPGAISSVITPLQTGDYSVTASDFYCSLSSQPFSFNPSGVAEHSEHPFLLFPNPATEKFNFISDFHIKEIEIHDISGRLVLIQLPETNQFEVDVQDLEKGLYLLRITGIDWQRTTTVLIE